MPTVPSRRGQPLRLAEVEMSAVKDGAEYFRPPGRGALAPQPVSAAAATEVSLIGALQSAVTGRVDAVPPHQAG